MRFFNAIRSMSMMSAISKKIPLVPTSLRSVRELATNQQGKVYATQEVVIGANKLKKKKGAQTCDSPPHHHMFLLFPPSSASCVSHSLNDGKEEEEDRLI
uniref:Uncharacterized protein n=1 Tax=Caenorhabditis tropicalis TaxID=1561998 RepID=A0A1I7UUV5_9PELO